MTQSKRKYGGYYVNRFISMKLAVSMLEHQLFPNAKEITESFAICEAAFNHLDHDFTDNVTVIVVGDGTKPRTAALFTHRSKWKAISIDPILKNRNYSKIARLSIIPKKIEEVSLTFDHPVIIAQPHSHAILTACLKSIRAPQKSIIAMPCCVPQFIPNVEPDEVFKDEWVWSPENTIKIWKNLNEHNNSIGR